MQGEKKLFEGLWIAQSNYTWKPYGVIRLDFSELSIKSAEDFEISLKNVCIHIGKQHEISLNEESSVNDIFRELIYSLSSKTPSKAVVVLIDEYD